MTSRHSTGPISDGTATETEGDMATKRRRTNKRATAPNAVRRVARAAGLDLRGLAQAVISGQPTASGRPDQADQNALLGWLAESARNARPNADEAEIADSVAAQLREMADAGDATAQDVLDAGAEEIMVDFVRVEVALIGGGLTPCPPQVSKPERTDAIAATILNLTDWPAVPDDTVQAIYRWLFGDEALFVLGTELRLQAGQCILENPALREVEVPHPETGEPVVVTREEIKQHAEADLRVLLDARRYSDRTLAYHARVMRVLEPYFGDEHATVAEAARAAAPDYGIDPADHDPQELIDLLLAAASRREAPSTPPKAPTPLQVVPLTWAGHPSEVT